MVLLYPLLAGGSPSPIYHCEMKWDLPPKNQSTQNFELSGNAEVHPYPQVNVSVSGDQNSSGVTVSELYGSHGQDHILYKIRCDSALNCQGNKSELIDQRETVTSFSFTPATVAIARIQKRELFRYHPTAHGFFYQFTQYHSRDGQPRGMELSCHE
jgi:hypothetical protein